MIDETSDLDRLSQRVNQLERSNRRLRGGALALGLALCAAVLMGQTKPHKKVVKATRFVLQDPNGVERGRWEVTPSGAVKLALRGQNGAPRVSLAVHERGHPQLQLLGPSGRPLVDLAMHASGHVGLGLFDAKGKPRASLYLKQGGKKASLVLMDSSNRKRSALEVLPDGSPHLSLYDTKKQARASVYLESSGAPRVELYTALRAQVRIGVLDNDARGIVLYGKKGKPLAGIGIDTANRPSIRLITDKGKQLFKAP